MEYQCFSGKLIGERYEKGCEFEYLLAVPPVKGPLGLYVSHDGKGELSADTAAILALAQEGKAPYCACLCITCGMLPLEGAATRRMRPEEYDMLAPDYGRFLTEEAIPRLAVEYGLDLSPDPDLHLIAGSSSGGLSSLTVAWFFPEVFHRVYLSSPSMLAMGRGNELPVLIRKSETKPLRIYEEYSADEPDDYFGSSFCAAMETERALQFAGYDFRCRYFPEGGHGYKWKDGNEARIRMAWLWEGYRESPVTAPRNSVRVDRVVPEGSRWEPADAFPDKEGTTLSLLSSDRVMRYTGSPEEDVIYARTEKGGRFYHGFLHTLPAVAPKGALDMALDEADRLYVLTAVGIQCVRSAGLIDVILELPDRSRPLQIAIGGKDGRELFVRTEKGISRRPLCRSSAKEVPTPPEAVSYYD